MNRYPNLVTPDVDCRCVTEAAVTQKDRIRLMAKATADSANNLLLVDCVGSFAENWFLGGPIGAKDLSQLSKARLEIGNER